MTALDVDERQQVAASVRAACDRWAPEERIRAVSYDSGEPAGFDSELWKVLCSQVGVTTIGLPEQLGGAGLGTSALGVVAHEVGRSLAPVPFVTSAVLAMGLLVQLRDEVSDFDARLPGLLNGERTLAAVLTGDAGLWRPEAVTLRAEDQNGEWRIHGSARHVLHGGGADDFVVAAITAGRPALFVAAASAEGVSVRAERVLDGTRAMATLGFDATPAMRLAAGDDVAAIIGRAMDQAIAVLSAEQVGACERVLEIATAYARDREQFGRPIGSFQAVKHKCADMLVDLEWARSASQAALEGVDSEAVGESRWRVSMAKAVCSEALRNAASANVQIHGGIGFTWEDAAHLYVRRARTDEVLFGRPSEHWDRLAAEAKII